MFNLTLDFRTNRLYLYIILTRFQWDSQERWNKPELMMSVFLFQMLEARQSLINLYPTDIYVHNFVASNYFDHVTWRNEKLYLALPSLCAFLRAWRCKKCFLWQNKQRNFSYSLKITDSNSGRRSNRNHATWLWKPRGHKNILISLINSN